MEDFYQTIVVFVTKQIFVEDKELFYLCLQSDTDVDQIDNENNNNNNDENRFDLLAALMRNQ